MGISVGQFCDAFYPVVDGVVTVVKNYAEILNTKYGDCFVVAPENPGYVDNESFDVIRVKSIALPQRPPYRFGMYRLDRKAKHEISNHKIDIIHAHSPFGIGNDSLRVARKNDIPIVATFHSKFYDDFKQILKFDSLTELVIKYVIEYFNKVDQVWTVNNATALTLRDYGFKGNIEVVQNGADVKYPENAQELIDRTNSKYGLSSDENIFLFVGQHIWQKNIKNLILAMSKLKEKGLKYKLLMVGSGYAKEDLESMAKELDLDDYVKFLGVVYDREELAGLYLRADIFIFPSLYDNASVVVKEAAAMRTPSVLIKGSNTAEGVIDNENGFLTENSPEEIADRINEAIKEPDLLKQAGKRASETLTISWEYVVDEVYGRYAELIDLYKKKGTNNYEKEIYSK